MKRGEVYYTNSAGYPVGNEIAPARPALIVSNDKNNTFSTVVEVVYLTSQEKKDLPTHVKVRCKGVPSTILCEQICSISKSKLGNYMGTLTPAEMQMVDIALAISIGINSAATALPSPNAIAADNSNAAAEKDIYKRLYEELLERVLER